MCKKLLILGSLLAALAAALPACKPAANRLASAPRAPTAGPGVHVLAQRLAMPGLGRERTLRLYLPPSYESNPARRYPVLYMHDAQNLFDDATSFAGEWGVDETLDDFARTRGFEAIVVGIDHGDAERTHELSPWTNPKYGPAQGEQYMAFVVDTVKPWIDAHYRTQPGRESTAILGSSMGGLISHYAIQRYPEVFSKAGVFSPSYWVSPQLYTIAAEQALLPDARLYLFAGGKEGGGMDEAAVKMHQTLLQKNTAKQLQLHIEPGAQHNEAAWRAEFGRAVRWLFAPN